MKSIGLHICIFLILVTTILQAQSSKDKLKNEKFISQSEKYIAEHKNSRALKNLRIIYYSRDDCRSLQEIDQFYDSLYFAGYRLNRVGIYKSFAKKGRNRTKEILEIGNRYEFDFVLDGDIYCRLERTERTWKNPPATLEPAEVRFDGYRNRVIFNPPDHDYYKIEYTTNPPCECCTEYEPSLYFPEKRWLEAPVKEIDPRNLFYSTFGTNEYKVSHKKIKKYSMYRAGRLVCTLEFEDENNFILNGEPIDQSNVKKEWLENFRKNFEGDELKNLQNAVVQYFRFNPNERCKYPVEAIDWTIPVADERQGPLDLWEATVDMENEDSGIRYKISGTYWCNTSQEEQLIFPITFYSGSTNPKELTTADDPENPNNTKGK
jgi:hypothetical protein